MSNSIAETVIGAAVVVVAAGFVVYAGQSRGLQLNRDSYELSAAFRSVEGVSVGTDVRLAGIKVGSVTALELDPENYEARNNLAGLYAEAGRLPEAVLQLRAVLQAYPRDAKALANLGRIYLQLGRPYDAGSCFDRLRLLSSAGEGAGLAATAEAGLGDAAEAGLAAAAEMADRVEADEMAQDPAGFLSRLHRAAAANPQDRFLAGRLRKLEAGNH